MAEYNRAIIRELLEKSFNGEEFETFCFDHFSDVKSKFTTGQTQDHRIQLLMEYCQGHFQFEKLFQKIEEENPEQWQLYKDKITDSEPTPNTICPYMGLSAFHEKDAEFFFGRETFTQRLLEAVVSKPIVAVIGSSGSGKSSVVYAGLIPRLRKEGKWLITNFRPGNEPLQNLVSAILPIFDTKMSKTDLLIESKKMLTGFKEKSIKLQDVVSGILKENPGSKILLFVDQFEELYTLSADDSQDKRIFIENLFGLAKESQENIRFIFTMRADFLGKALSDPQFSSVISDSALETKFAVKLMIGSMSKEELQDIIQKPAFRVGLEIEKRLTDRILKHVEEKPSNLPLLEFFLEELWRRQSNRTLTHSAYEGIGKMEGALASYADGVFKEFPPAEKDKIQHIFIQLVKTEQGTEDTRRLANIQEIGAENWELVKKLADKRLVVTNRRENEETVEVIHEALIREWEQLKGWINKHRKFRAWQDDLRYLMEHNRILREIDLLQAEEWLKTHREYISKPEVEFIEKSIQARNVEIKKEKQKRRILTALTGLSVVLTLAVSGFAYHTYSQLPEVIIKKAADESKWSDYQGRMNWNDAVAKCKSLGKGFRLPTQLEWKGIYKHKPEVMKKWQDDGCCFYWTGEEYSDDRAYFFDIYNGVFDSDFKYSDGHVRCIR